MSEKKILEDIVDKVENICYCSFAVGGLSVLAGSVVNYFLIDPLIILDVPDALFGIYLFGTTVMCYAAGSEITRQYLKKKWLKEYNELLKEKA